ncbi:MAG: Ppx/GppA phosphatase family protein, partial [Clostridium sp.]
NIIKTACILHDCGTSIDYYNHHKHSFYIIMHSRLNGLTHKELVSSAAIAAMHRNNSYTLPFPQFSYIINRLDFGFIEKIGVLLRIAEGLDRTLIGSVKEIDVTISEEDVILTIGSKGCINLEISQALRSSKKFYEVYGKNLIINSKKI